MQNTNAIQLRPTELKTALKTAMPSFKIGANSALRHHWSLEATLPTARDLDAMADLLPPGTRVYLSALPRVSCKIQLANAVALKKAGLEPVPHISARKFRDREHLADYLKSARNDAGVEKALVIAGDFGRPRGPYASSLDVIADTAFLRSGLAEVGISGYPEGHPLIDAATLDEVLSLKINALVLASMTVEIVTQFSFDDTAIIAWHERLRRRGVVCPIRVGIAGPAKAGTLLKLALRCGVNLPSRATNTAVQLMRGHNAEDILASLDGSSLAQDGDRRTSLHFYSFGGAEKTARWATSILRN